MEKLFQRKYRIPSARLRNFDYSQDNYYFITICTKDKKNFFGRICDEEIRLSRIGKIAKEYWEAIPQHFPFVKLDKFVVMPNHIHGIVIIDKWGCGEKCGDVGRDEAMPRLYKGKHPQMSKISPKPKSLSSIIGSFKSIVAKTANKQYPQMRFAWQPRFFDRIIRDEKEFCDIQAYILTNPENWEKDEENLEANLCR